MNTTIDACLESASTSNADKTFKKEDSDHLCSLMKMLKMKVTASLDYDSTVIALQGSFVAKVEQCTDTQYNGIVDSWICIEDGSALKMRLGS